MTPDERKTNIEKILGLYRIIEIAAIGVKGRLPMQIVAATDDISFQKLEKLQSKGDGIYFGRPLETSITSYLSTTSPMNTVTPCLESSLQPAREMSDARALVSVCRDSRGT
jgi:hypothetical protein